MHDFKYKNGTLYGENVAIGAIAQEVGTPFYCYSHNTLVDHFTKIQKAFARIDPVICFAMKSNDNLAVIKTLVDLGAGLDIVSIGELKKAQMVNADPLRIVFASVGKTEEEIAYAIKAGILFFNVESLPELEEINRIAKGLDIQTQVALRVNPDVAAATHAKITTGTLQNKFGIDLKTARAIIMSQKKYSHVRINGLHCHIGSQIKTSKPFISAIKKVGEFIKSLQAEGVNLEYLDIGGGLAAIYKDEQVQTAKDYAKAITPYLEKINLRIIMEPGRFIVCNAG